MSPNTRKVLRQLFPIAFGFLVLFLLARALEGIRFEDVWSALRDLPAAALAKAVTLTALGYFWIIGYDYLALRYLRREIPRGRLVFTSLSAFAVQRNVGPAPITGGAIRYRYYRRFGVSGGEAAVLTVLCGFAFTLGIVLVAGLALLLEPESLERVLRAPEWLFRLGGLALLLGLAGFLVWSQIRQRPIRVRSWEAPPPSIGISLAQLLFGAVDIAIVAAVVYVLLPAQVALPFPAFVGLYVLAMLVGAVSHVPGGAGVFESVLLVLLPGDAPGSVVLASLLAFRGVYYLLPLLVMGSAMGAYELGNRVRGTLQSH